MAHASNGADLLRTFGQEPPSRRRGSPPTLGRKGVALLAEVPLFAGLSRRHLRRLANLAEEVPFGTGRTVVQNGSRGNAFYVIVEGTAKVLAGYSTRTFARLGPGDSSESWLCSMEDHEPRPSSRRPRSSRSGSRVPGSEPC